MDNLTYQRIVTAIRFEIMFWALVIIAQICFIAKSAWGVLPFVTALITWAVAAKLDARWKKLLEESKP